MYLTHVLNTCTHRNSDNLITRDTIVIRYHYTTHPTRQLTVNTQVCLSSVTAHVTLQHFKSRDWLAGIPGDNFTLVCWSQQNTGMVGLAPKWVRLAPNGTNPGLFQIRFQYIWLDEPNVLKFDLKKFRICPIWGPIWPTLESNLPSL